MLTTSLSRCKGSSPRTCTLNNSSSKYWCSSTTSSNQPILYLANNLWTLLAGPWSTLLSSPPAQIPQTSLRPRLCPLEITSNRSTYTCWSCRLNKIPKWAALCLGRKGRKCRRNKIKDLRVMVRAIVNIMGNNNTCLKNRYSSSTPCLRTIAPGHRELTWVPRSLSRLSRQPIQRPFSSSLEASTNLTWAISGEKLIIKIKSQGVKILLQGS